MIAAVIALGLVAAALVGVLLLVLRLHESERKDWVMERRSLIDRVIAQHTGEVIALDRNQRPPRERPDVPQAIGLG